ncbi:MAG: (2Fe-2S)-binding protein [Bacteroidia bacterium]|nr:MAG: (2Fe-2S)-binding protein [Bacteroidia bacterium]
MISFILNNQEIHTEEKSGTTLLDFIRYREHLTGTKIGCREGDCGACTVLEGQLAGGRIEYRSIVSCLTPLGNAHGKHIVTVEGISSGQLNPVQEAFVEHNGTQCGFCTPGFVVALTGYTMDYKPIEPKKAIDSMSGNICRCTGYKSIERAAITVANVLADKNPDNPIGWLVSKGYLPAYFVGIPERLAAIRKDMATPENGGWILGGGTDLMVQRPDDIAETNPVLLFDRQDLKGIRAENGRCIVGAAVTATDMKESLLFRTYFPRLDHFMYLVSSEPIRNMGTIGGNIVNASPIADLVAFFLALDADVHLYHTKTEADRVLPLRKFFLDYKKMDKEPEEIIHHISFAIPGERTYFHFEKVSRRITLDIASVNSAISIEADGRDIVKAHVSVGGVAPVPLYLQRTSTFLAGKPLEEKTIIDAARIMDAEIAPISDIRGSKEYKRLLARQLFYAHFLELFPGKIHAEELVNVF